MAFNFSAGFGAPAPTFGQPGFSFSKGGSQPSSSAAQLVGFGGNFGGAPIAGFPTTGGGGGGGGSSVPLKKVKKDTASDSTSSGTTSTTGQSSSVSNEVGSSIDTRIFDKQNMTDPSLAALENLIAGGGAGSDLLAAQDEGKAAQQQQMNAMIATLDPSQAAEMARGRTAELSRTLREQLLPEIFGGAENSGFGGSALSQLLGQDAAIRTGEAQARVEEDVRSNVQDQATQANQVLNALLDSGSGVNDALQQALQTAKGAVEQGSEVTTGATNTTGTTTTASQSDENKTARQRIDEASNITEEDPLGFAKLQAQLQMSQQNKPSKGELALALFNASKSPFQTLSDLGPTRPGSLSNSFSSGSQNLMSTIGQFLG